MNQIRTPLLAGSSSKDSLSLTGWGTAVFSGVQEIEMELFERLRNDCEPISMWDERIPELAQTSFYRAMGEWIVNDIHGLWLPPESRDGHNPLEMAETIARRSSEMQALYDCSGTRSPIEEMMAGALMWTYCDWLGFPNTCWVGGPKDRLEVEGPRDEISFHIATQADFSPYAVDFVLWFSYQKSAYGVVVECDGHNFHDKTKEQAARDKRRDREIVMAGFPVARFTGSEIYANPLACRDQVVDLLSDAKDRVSKEAGLY